MATLEQFLKAGELGPIRSGLTEAECRDLLGPPEDVYVPRLSLILKYGSLQLSFVAAEHPGDQQLALIGLYFRPGRGQLPELVRPTDFPTEPQPTLSDVRAFLARISLSATTTTDGEDATYLILPSGARMTVEGELLQSIHLQCAVRMPAKKQIAVSVPAATWARIRELARQSNQSVAELCASWITQRASEANEEHTSGVGHVG